MTPEFIKLLSFMVLTLLGFLWIKSFKILLRSEFIFGYVENWFRSAITWAMAKDRRRIKNLLEWLSKPLYGCVFCMSSIHGILVFSLTKWAGLHSLEWAVVLLYLPVLMGIITLYYADPYDYEIDADEKQ